MIFNPDIVELMTLISDHVRAKDPDFVLEIGPAQGNGSTIAIQDGLDKISRPLHISVDIRDYMEVKPTYECWHLVLGDSRDLETLFKVKAICGSERKPDVIFIDTDHTYEQMKAELEIWGRFAKESTVWLFHDTWMNHEYNNMTDAIKEYALANGLVYKDLTLDSHGLGYMGRQ